MAHLLLIECRLEIWVILSVRSPTFGSLTTKALLGIPCIFAGFSQSLISSSYPSIASKKVVLDDVAKIQIGYRLILLTKHFMIRVARLIFPFGRRDFKISLAGLHGS